MDIVIRLRAVISTGFLAASLGLTLASVGSATVFIDEQAATGFSGDIYGDHLEIGAPLGGTYRLSLLARAFHYGDAFGGTTVEYSAMLRKYLYHVTISGRLGTRPPQTQGAAYHLAQGEGLMTFYGLTLGPEHPEMSAAIWESTEPTPSPALLDHTWITAVRGRYTDTDNHIRAPNAFLTLVENTTQVELRETWRERASVASEMGWTHYNKNVDASTPRVFMDNVNYPGGSVFGIDGWPNNYFGAQAWLLFGPYIKISEGFTRLNLLDDSTEFLLDTRIQCLYWEYLRPTIGYYHRRRRGSVTREAASLGFSYVW